MPVPVYRFHGSKPPVAGSRTPIFKTRNETELPEVVDGVAAMRVYDPIDSWGGDWGISAKEFARALDMLPAETEEIRLYINSPGGEIDQAVTMMNDLRAHDAKVVAYVNGLAASCASFLASSADETVMARQTQFMIHDGWGLCVGPAADMRAVADILDQSSDTIASIYAEKAGGDTATWRAAMLAETWYTADETVAAGLADRVDGEKATNAKAFDTRTLFNHAGRDDAPAPVIPPAPDHKAQADDAPARAAVVRREHAHRARARKMRVSAA